MATIAIVGVTGYAGGRIAAEAASRGHEVLGVARTIPQDVSDKGIFRAGSIYDWELREYLMQAADVVVLAVPSHAEDGILLADSVPALLECAQRHSARLGVVGGAGSLRISPDGPSLIETGTLPEFAMSEIRAQASLLSALRESDGKADWFYVRPAVVFGAHAPGTRTGRYRVGDEILLQDSKGESAISGEDYAVAFLDEIDSPRHRNTRFTVAY